MLAGTYTSPELTLELRDEGGELRGQLVSQGARLPARAVADGAGLRGSFHAGGTDLPFSAVLDGDSLRLDWDGARHLLARAAPADRQLFRHPTGAELRLPPGWSAQPGAAGVQLVPPGPTGPAELYLVSAEAAPDIQSPDDPRVLEYLDESVAEMLPGAMRAGGPEPLGAGIRLRWSGRHPLTGGALEMISLVTLLRGIAVGVSALGEPATIAPRLTDIVDVFASLSWGQGDLDPALVGVWHQSSAETRRLYELAADGSARGNENAGTWSAGGGLLYIMWQDGQTATFQYRVTGPSGDRQVMLQTGREKPFSWTERPIQV